MLKRSLWLGLSLVVVASCVVVVAQQPGGPGGPDGQRRTFRAMMVPGGGIPLVMFIGTPEVQKELGIGEEQQKTISELQAEHQKQSQALFTGPDPRQQRDPPPEEREQEFAKVRAKMEELNRTLDDRLVKALKPEQHARLQQLRLQREGVPALLRRDIADKLSITDEQQEKIRGIQEKVGIGSGPPRQDPQAMKNALAVLDDKQGKLWSDLTGKEFTFPEPSFPGFGPGGFPRPGGPMGGQERKLVKEFDKDDNGWLNNEERQAARKTVQSGGDRGFGGRGPGGPGRGPGPGGPGGFGPGGRDEEGKPGPKIAKDDVKPVEGELYDPQVLRTLFLDFENADWEKELADFHNTDVEVPATLTVDGKTYANVGVHFRGMSSYGMVREGSKRSLNVSLDLVDDKQRLHGYKTLNLLNSHEDPTFLHTVIYSHIARQHIAAPKANLVKVVINGESWGVYVNAQQFDKIFAAENFKGSAARWKVRGSPGGRGGLEYLGDKVDDYKRRYEIKSGDSKNNWEAFVKLCRTLNETPADQLEEAIAPMLDMDSTLWFLALDNALINSDGYWVRASDYNLCLDKQGKFHLVPHDMNETFGMPMGPGMGGPGGRGPGGPSGRIEGGPRGGRPEGEPDGPRSEGAGRRERGPRPEGVGPGPDGGPRPEGPGRGPGGNAGGYSLDPLVGISDNTKPLRSKLLSVPKFREQYLRNVRTIAAESLDWKQLGPVVAQYESLIEKEIEADTRKLTSFTAFKQSVSQDSERSAVRSLLTFVQERRKFLLSHEEIKKLGESGQQ